MPADDEEWAHESRDALRESHLTLMVELAASHEERGEPDLAKVPPRTHADERSSPLSRREIEVARLAAQGLTNRQIAAALSISEHTAANHVRKILKKLGLRSRTQITAQSL